MSFKFEELKKYRRPGFRPGVYFVPIHPHIERPGSWMGVAVRSDGPDKGVDFLSHPEFDDWVPYEEPKPKVLRAPAVVKRPRSIDGTKGFLYEFHGLFVSEEDARADVEKNTIDAFVYWPAIPNAQGFYEAPE